MGTLRFFEEVVSFKIRRTFGFADYSAPAWAAYRIFIIREIRCVFQRLPYKINSAEAESEQIRRCVGSIIFVPDRRRFGDLYVRVRTIELFAFF